MYKHKYNSRGYPRDTRQKVCTRASVVDVGLMMAFLFYFFFFFLSVVVVGRLVMLLGYSGKSKGRGPATGVCDPASSRL